MIYPFNLYVACLRMPVMLPLNALNAILVVVALFHPFIPFILSLSFSQCVALFFLKHITPLSFGEG